MARKKTCLKCHQEFTAAQYLVHQYAHRRDEFSQREPGVLPTSGLLPIEVPDDSDEEMEDVFNAPDEAVDHALSPKDDPFSDNHENTENFPTPPDPFSDVHATTSTTLLPQDPPIASTSHLFLPPPPSDEDMDSSMSSHHSEQNSAEGPASPLIDEDLGFEDSSLDPTSRGHPSLSEQLKERFLADYHGGGVSDVGQVHLLLLTPEILQ